MPVLKPPPPPPPGSAGEGIIYGKYEEVWTLVLKPNEIVRIEVEK